jgi:hypothetical protein
MTDGVRRHGNFAEAVEPFQRRHPDVALAIFEQSLDAIAGQSIRARECVHTTVVDVHQSPIEGADPYAAMTIAQEP